MLKNYTQVIMNINLNPTFGYLQLLFYFMFNVEFIVQLYYRFVCFIHFFFFFYVDLVSN